MTARARIALTLVVTLIVCVIFWFFFIKPRQDELAQVNRDIETAENEQQRLTVEVNRLQALEADRLELTTRLTQIRQFVPQEHDTPSFIFQVQDAALDAGVGFVQITPEPPRRPPEGAALAQVRITIGAGGGYFAIQDFIRRLYDLDRAVRIDVVNLQGREGDDEVAESGLIEMQMNLRIFFELPEAAAPPATVPGGTAPAPGASPTPAAADGGDAATAPDAGTAP